MSPLTQLAHLFPFNDNDPFSFERDILPLWYQFTLILALTFPLLYLTHRVPYRSFLALVTAFANDCSYTEPYNLARPIYVCFYPVKGETFHHPEERRLRTQYSLFFNAALLACLVALSTLGQRVYAESRQCQRSDRKDELMKQERRWLDDSKEMNVEEEIPGKRSGEKRKVRKVGALLVRNWGRNNDVLMWTAWCLTVYAWLVMWGHSKKGKFGD